MDVPASSVLPWTSGACKPPQWHSCISLKDFSWNKKSKPLHLRLPDNIGRQNPERPGEWGTTGRYEKSSQLLVAFQGSWFTASSKPGCPQRMVWAPWQTPCSLHRGWAPLRSCSPHTSL